MVLRLRLRYMNWHAYLLNPLLRLVQLVPQAFLQSIFRFSTIVPIINQYHSALRLHFQWSTQACLQCRSHPELRVMCTSRSESCLQNDALESARYGLSAAWTESRCYADNSYRNINFAFSVLRCHIFTQT